MLELITPAVLEAVAAVPAWRWTWQRVAFPFHVARILFSLGRSSSVVLLVVAAGLHVLTGCAPDRPAAHYVESGTAVAYSSAVVALELLDDAEARRIAALESPTVDQLAEAETRVRRLELARDALAVVRKYLTEGRPTDDLRGPLSDSVKLLRQAADGGLPVPQRASDALAVAEAWLTATRGGS